MAAENMNARCAALMKKLAAADFYALDLRLYLNTHPEDEQALCVYKEAVKQAEACKAAFEAQCYPICAESAGKGCQWDWLSGQWIM